MTRGQEDTAMALAEQHGEVCVRDGYADGHAEVTTRAGKCYRLTGDGRVASVGVDHSVTEGWA